MIKNIYRWNGGWTVRTGDYVATESFYEDMVIDTKEAADNLNELVESGVTWKRGNSVLKFASADSEIARKLVEKYSHKEWLIW